MGIDLGTANTLVHVQGRGIVLDEPSVVAVSRRTGQVLSVGADARRMLGRTPADIVALRPLKDGVIADFEHTEQMIKHFITKAHNREFHVSHPRVVVGVPSGVTEVDADVGRPEAQHGGQQTHCRDVWKSLGKARDGADHTPHRGAFYVSTPYLVC